MKIVNAISPLRVPKWGNTHQYIVIHYLGVDGQNHNLDASGCGAHYYIYWDGTVYQRCTHDAIVWAVGTAGIYKQKHPYARNNNSISIELCCHCDGNKASAEDPKWYFTEATQVAAVELVQKLMKELNIPIDHVLRHFDVVTKTCPAPYVHNNKYKGTWTWNEFLDRVQGKTETQKKAEPLWYRVRKSWEDEKSQLGAYEDVEIAIDHCPSGYKVFDVAGNAVFCPIDMISSAQWYRLPKGLPPSKNAYIEAVGAICRELAKETGILAQVVAGQCCLETGFGRDPKCFPLVEVNNLLGMKSDLINNTWSDWSVWEGKSVTKPTKEYNGKMVTVDGTFRVYKDYAQCIRDYEMFLLHVRDNSGYKYRHIYGVKDPLTALRIIYRDGHGYATDPEYVDKVMRVIKENNLARFDKGVEMPTMPLPVASDKQWYRVAKDYKNGVYVEQDNAYEDKENAIARAEKQGLKAYDPDGNVIYPTTQYAVRRKLNEEKYQLGVFDSLKQAKEVADLNWGFAVFDLTIRKKVYAPKINNVQKFCAAMVRLNQWLVDDIRDGKDWRYYNSSGKVSESTFWKTRSAGKLYTNCMGGVAFALKEAGIPASACSWYGAKGFIRWLNDHAEADLRKYADIIEIGGKKTVTQLYKDGTLCPGDILTFQTFNHTCAYLGNGLSYDSGHAYCREKTGEGAHYVKWIGELSWASYKVAYIIRLKG